MNEEENYYMLIAAAKNLLTCAVIVSDKLPDHQDMLIPAIDQTRYALSQCPDPDGTKFAWSGTLLDDDVIVTRTSARYEDGRTNDNGASVADKRTGIERQSTSKNSFEDNVEVAKRHLIKALDKFYGNEATQR